MTSQTVTEPLHASGRGAHVPDAATQHQMRRRSYHRERRDLHRWLKIGLLLRLSLMLAIHFTGAARTLGLTKDAYLYERVGQQMAEYWRTGGIVPWPTRVTSVFDSLFEWEVGIVFYLTGDSSLVLKLINVLAGSLVPFVVWKTARLVFEPRVARLCLIGAVLFPTQVYYSTIMVRDAQSTLAMSLIFLGLTAAATRAPIRDLLGLPVGLLLIAGLRSYMFTLLVFLIPAGWMAAMLMVPSLQKSRAIARIVVVSTLCLACLAGIGLNSVFIGREGAQVTDIEFLNKVRSKMNRGTGALYASEELPRIGEDAVDTTRSIATGLYYFFFSVDPTEMDSVRQFLAIPEVLLIVYAFPALIRGTRRALRSYLFPLFVPLLIAIAVTFAYSGVATNAGPMMRWRLQIVNVYIMVAALGWERHPQRRRRPAVSLRIPEKQIGNASF